MADHRNDIVVVALARTPFGRFEGALKEIDAPRLGALAINGVLSASLHSVGGCRIFSSVRAFRGRVMACGTTG